MQVKRASLVVQATALLLSAAALANEKVEDVGACAWCVNYQNPLGNWVSYCDFSFSGAEGCFYIGPYCIEMGESCVVCPQPGYGWPCNSGSG